VRERNLLLSYRSGFSQYFFKLFPPIILLLPLLFFTCNAISWEFPEHFMIGQEAYRSACEKLKTEYHANPLYRGIACLNYDNEYYYAKIYGQSCAIACDHIENPSEFASKLAGRKAFSLSEYGKIARQNSDHFHPYVTRSWEDYQNKALSIVEKGIIVNSIEAGMIFKEGLIHEAFAGHYLQDSFSTGHMGFNRPASSASASVAFHDYYNKKGRLLQDGKGDLWLTKGDGSIVHGICTEDKNCLEQCLKEKGCRKIVEASTDSVIRFLTTFFTGKRDVENELNTSLLLPHSAEVYNDLGLYIWNDDYRADIKDKMKNLNLINKPVYTSLTADVWAFTYGPIEDDGSNFIGTVAGGSVHYPLYKYKYIPPVRLYFGVGNAHFLDRTSIEEDNLLVFDAGYILHLFNTFDGLLSHELSFGATWVVGEITARNLCYRLNFEIGKLFIRLQAGYADGGFENEQPDTHLLFDRVDSDIYSYYFSIGLGYALKAVGGGVHE
jgi:hypothetical protein